LTGGRGMHYYFGCKTKWNSFSCFNMPFPAVTATNSVI